MAPRQAAAAAGTAAAQMRAAAAAAGAAAAGAAAGGAAAAAATQQRRRRPRRQQQQQLLLLAAAALPAVLLLAAAPRPAAALDFEMQSKTKCIFEELNANVIVVGDYKAVNKANPTLPIYVDVDVTDPNGAVLHTSKAQASGQFAFTTKTAGEYQACFSTHDHETALHTRLTVDWRTGVAATDWDTIAKKEHLDQLSVEMRKVEGSIREIYAEMLQLQQREQEMRDLNEETNARVAWFSIFSLAVCVASAGFQLVYLRRFFQRKKLL